MYPKADPDDYSEDERRRIIAEVQTAIRALPRRRQKAFVRKMCSGLPLKFIRDFAVIDTSGHPRFKSQSVIYHLPSGLWSAFPSSFDSACDEVMRNPARDHELIVYLHEV